MAFFLFWLFSEIQIRTDQRKGLDSLKGKHETIFKWCVTSFLPEGILSSWRKSRRIFHSVVVHRLLPWQVIIAHHAGIWYTAHWWLLNLPWSQGSPCKYKSRSLSLESQKSRQALKTTGDWFAQQDSAVRIISLKFRRLADKLLAKSKCTTWTSVWGWRIEVCFSDFMQGSRLIEWVKEIH